MLDWSDIGKVALASAAPHIGTLLRSVKTARRAKRERTNDALVARDQLRTELQSQLATLSGKLEATVQSLRSDVAEVKGIVQHQNTEITRLQEQLREFKDRLRATEDYCRTVRGIAEAIQETWVRDLAALEVKVMTAVGDMQHQTRPKAAGA